MVERAGIEPAHPGLQPGALTTLAISPFAIMDIWQGRRDSNPGLRFWRPECWPLHHTPVQTWRCYSLRAGNNRIDNEAGAFVIPFKQADNFLHVFPSYAVGVY